MLKMYKLQHISCPLCSSKEYDLIKEINVWRIVKCKKCGFCYNNPRPNKGYLRRQYTNRSSIDESILQLQESYPLSYFFNRKLDLIEHAHKKGRILDIGCGAGLFLDIAKRRDWETYGLDPSSWVKEVAKKKGFKSYIGYIQALNIPSNYFDVVFSSATLEHLSDPLGDLKEMYRILKQNGLFFATSIPNFNAITIKLGLPDFRANSPPEHLNYFTPITLKKILRLVGFREIRVYPYGFDYQGIINKVSVKIPKYRTKSNSSKRKTFKHHLMKIFIKLYSNPWHFGDKLEVICHKS